MADNTTLTIGSGGDTIRDKDRSGVKTQIVGLDLAPGGSETLMNGSMPVTAASLPLPSGASTAAKQPALGTAGSASSDVITVQGVASMTPLLVTASFASAQAVTQSGTWTVGISASQTIAVTNTGTFAVQAAQSGTWNIGTVTAVTTVSTVTAVTALSNALPAVTNIMGKVGIDQTTPGTTNAVALSPNTASALLTARIAAASGTNATVVKNAPGNLYGWYLYNNTSSIRVIHFYATNGTPTAGSRDTVFHSGITSQRRQQRLLEHRNSVRWRHRLYDHDRN